MDVIHTPAEMGCDMFQLCMQFDMKIKLIPIISIFINQFGYYGSKNLVYKLNLSISLWIKNSRNNMF
jgi:hypothetical protein